MHLAHRRHVELSRRDEVGHLALLQLAQDIFDARRPLEGRDEFAAKELALRKMQTVIIGIDDLHEAPRIVSGAKLCQRFADDSNHIQRQRWGCKKRVGAPAKNIQSARRHPERSSMSSLANKIAIITGASSGIGRAAARLFAEEGAQLGRRGAASVGARSTG